MGHFHVGTPYCCGLDSKLNFWNNKEKVRGGGSSSFQDDDDDTSKHRKGDLDGLRDDALALKISEKAVW